jgi:hypothetical protein
VHRLFARGLTDAEDPQRSIRERAQQPDRRVRDDIEAMQNVGGPEGGVDRFLDRQELRHLLTEDDVQSRDQDEGDADGDRMGDRFGEDAERFEERDDERGEGRLADPSEGE